MPETTPLRIIVVVNQLLGWSQNFITRELVTLAEIGVDVRVASRSVDERSDLSPAEDELASTSLQLPENPFLPRELTSHIVFALRNAAAYYRAWRHFWPIKHNRFQARMRSLVCLYRAVTVAAEVQRFKPDLIHAHFLTAPAETALYLSALTGIPWSATAHAMDIYRDRSGNGSKIADALFVTTCTEANRKFLAESFPDHTKKIVRIYHGLLKPGTEPPRLRTGTFVFLAVGRMVEKKGFDYLISACSIVGKQTDIPFVCRLVGDGPLLEAYRDRVRTERLERLVEFYGRAAVTAMDGHYASAAALVVPSVVTDDGDRDGIPNVCLEAMSHGLPVIGTNISGLPEVVRDGENGFLVPPADPLALSRAMLALLNHDDLAGLGEVSRTIVADSFDVERNVRSFVETADTYLRTVSCVG
ncbi:MAG: glycosyltransferase family 4 protein [Rhodothermales bacterium]|nr:glycosyltransferase family 4 protein [Rhodothermales bacterium]